MNADKSSFDHVLGWNKEMKYWWSSISGYFLVVFMFYEINLASYFCEYIKPNNVVKNYFWLLLYFYLANSEWKIVFKRYFPAQLFARICFMWYNKRETVCTSTLITSLLELTPMKLSSEKSQQITSSIIPPELCLFHTLCFMFISAKIKSNVTT